MRGIVILASCGYYFIRVHEILVQHPSNNISINSFAIVQFFLKYRISTIRDGPHVRPLVGLL